MVIFQTPLPVKYIKPLAVRVLNIKPQNIKWNIKFVKLLHDRRYISFIIVVPPTLVVCKRKQGWQLSIAWLVEVTS
jgi:hypothetical protein